MFCNQCGKQLPEGAKFCDACGYKLPEENNAVSYTAVSAQAPVINSMPAQGEQAKQGKKGKLWWKIVLAAAALLIAVVLVLFFAKKKDYVITYRYDVTEGEAYVSEIKVNKEYAKVVIPDIVRYDGVSYSVVGVDEMACYNQFKMESLVLPEGMRYIDDWAFFACGNLISVTMPDSVVSIGESAFADCFRLRELTLSSNLQYIGTEAFMGSRMSNLVIPAGLTNISEGAFSGCDELTNVEFLGDVDSIESEAFSYCDKLENVMFGGSVRSISSDAFQGCWLLVNWEFYYGL